MNVGFGPVNFGLQLSMGHDTSARGIYNLSASPGIGPRAGFSVGVYGDTYTQAPWWTGPGTGLALVPAS